jgi:hypothetical protein
VEYQRLVAPAVLEDRNAFVGFQVAAPGDPPIVRTDRVPEVADRGTLLVLGDCDALLWSDGHTWYVLEGSIDPETANDVPTVQGRGPDSRDPTLCPRIA